MRKVLVSIFPSEEVAYEGLSALKSLHVDGDITLYASTVLAKDANGSVAVRQAEDRGPIGTLVGLIGGSLVGLIGGPAGVAVGAYLGGVGGLMYDLFGLGIGTDFVDEVSITLKPGMSAVVAEIDESWITPVESRLGPLGAVTYRRIPDEIVDDQLNREAEAARAELAQLKAELADTRAEARQAIQTSIDAQVKKLHELSARIDKELDDASADFAARLATLEAQRAQAGEHRKATIDARIAELKANHEIRQSKLQRANELAREAHELRVEALTPAD